MVCKLLDLIHYYEATPDGRLGFWGTILGAAATILIAIITIKIDISRERKRRTLEAKPWLSSDSILINNISKFNEFNKDKILFIFKNGVDFAGSYKAPDRIMKDNYRYNQNECIVKYIFKNSGGNSATAINCSINNEPIMPQFTMSKDEEKVLFLILPDSEDRETNYKIKFEYGDIYYKKFYKQEETLVIKKDTNGVTLCQSNEELISKPQKTKKPKK